MFTNAAKRHHEYLVQLEKATIRGNQTFTKEKQQKCGETAKGMRGNQIFTKEKQQKCGETAKGMYVNN